MKAMNELIAKASTQELRAQVRRLEEVLTEADNAKVNTVNVRQGRNALTLLRAEIARRS